MLHEDERKSAARLKRSITGSLLQTVIGDGMQ
jgi:hypothetical protein